MAPTQVHVDPFEAAQPVEAVGDALSGLLADIERLALEVYGEHGLPTRRGHYRRGPRAARWAFVSERLSPSERFAMVLERPPERGWRFGTLEDLGAHEATQPELVQAARLLKGCGRIRLGLRGVGDLSPADALAEAVRLGAEWRALSDARAWRAGPRLTLKPPRRTPR
jgi:hypothetical protein